MAEQKAVHSGNYTLDVLEQVCEDYQSDYDMHLTDLQGAETREAFSSETKVNVGTYGPRGEDDGPQLLRFVSYTNINEATQARTQAIADGYKELFNRTLHVQGVQKKVLGFGDIQTL